MKRLLLAAFAAIVTGCAPAASTSSSAQAGLAGAPTASSAPGPTCPADNFEGFLRAFASDARVRDAFTAPAVTVTDWVDASVENPVEQTAQVPAARYSGFTLNFHAGGYYHLDADGNRYGDPVEVVTRPHGSGYEVRYVFGMSEGNSWLFKPDGDCWRLWADHESTWE